MISGWLVLVCARSGIRIFGTCLRLRFRHGTIIVYDGNRKTLDRLPPFVCRAHVFGRQIFSFTIGTVPVTLLKARRSLSSSSPSESADDNFEGTMKTNLVVQSNGSVLFVPPAIFKSICPFNIASFPFVSVNYTRSRLFLYLSLSPFFWIFKTVH